MQHVHSHQLGQAVLHLGRHRHGADDISTGERLNLIVWARNTAFRAAAAFGHVAPDGYPRAKEHGTPDLLCMSKANDRDYEEKVGQMGGGGKSGGSGGSDLSSSLSSGGGGGAGSGAGSADGNGDVAAAAEVAERPSKQAKTVGFG
jgi:uncharacterized membrane protein YgcG